MGDFGCMEGEEEGETWAKEAGGLGESGVWRGGDSSSERVESEPERGREREMGMGFDFFAEESVFWLSLMAAMM